MKNTATSWSYPVFKGARGPLTDADKLVFLHFEKTAGTTVATILQRMFDPAEVFPERSGLVRYWPTSVLQKYRLFMIHASIDDIRSISGPTKVVTFLRDPMDRLISLYRYWTSFKDSAIEAGNLTFPRYAKSLSFSEFISNKSVGIIPSLWNVYTQYLAGHHLISSDGMAWQNEDAMLQAALENLEQFAFVGIVENMESSLQDMHRELGIGTYDEQVRENVTTQLPIIDPSTFESPSPIIIDDEACERLHHITRLDRILYDAVLRRRCAPYPPTRTYTLQCGSGGRCMTHASEDWVAAKRPNDVLLHGPYVPMPAGHYRVDFVAKSNSPVGKQVNAGLFDVVTRMGTNTLARKDFHAIKHHDVTNVSLEFELQGPVGDIEFRAFTRESYDLMVKSQVRIQRL